MNISKIQSKTKRGRGGKYPETVKLDDIYKAFVKFASMPDPDKCEAFGILFNEKTGKYAYVPNQTHFALKYGVSQKTLSFWKNRPDFYMQVEREQMAWGIDKLSNVMAALYRRCLRFGISSDIELYLAYYAKWDKKHVVKVQGEKYDLDDIRALVGVLPEEKQKQFYELITKIIGEAETSIKHSEVSKYGTAQSEADTIDVRPEADPTLAIAGAGDKVPEKA